jgi:ATP-dependent exoDNAse (exonuclease V) beta subunit
MDARFDHWALDEFQDTSRGQWRALENLIEEASHPDAGKSVFIVGDRKQSIYEWRGGDVEILGEQARRAGRDGNLLQSLDESRRYVSVISRAVNNVFSESFVRGAIDMDRAPESAKWKFREHVSHDAQTVGFVEVVQAVKSGRQAVIADFFAPVANALNAVKPWERGISTAVLVRRNSTGEALLGYLKTHGISQAVFEGDSFVADCPVLSAMTELVRLAEHAGDELAYAHIGCSPIAAAMFPEGMPGAAELSAGLLEEFTRCGMVRKFREVREKLKKVPDSWNAFTESRFEDFIKCAAEFEEMRDSTMRLSDFADFLSRRTRRDFAEPGMVRIMTMHQSKGLGFDWVIIPFYEPEKMTGASHAGALVHADPAWILSNPGTAAAMSDPVLASAERARRQIQTYNSLCLNYVAMTRAKLALTLILHPPNRTPAPMPEKFSDLVRHSGLATSGDPSWYTKVRRGTRREETPERPPVARQARLTVRKLRPSESFYSGLGGDALFSEDFGKAARRGTEAHAGYERIEWIDSAAAENDFDRALVKPEGEVTLWRERAYEIFTGGRWESGQFDRVVFTLKDGRRSAVIYDFKTNALRGGESADDFAGRMRRRYAGQMSAYRQALSALTGMAPEDIRTVLLLECTKTALSV